VNLKQIAGWAALAFVVWWIIQQPTNAAHLVQHRHLPVHGGDWTFTLCFVDLRPEAAMRLVPSSDTVPTSVNKYLLPHERQVITVRQHPAVLIRPIAEVLGGLALAGFLSNSVAHGNNTVILVIWGLWAVLVLRLVGKVFEWSVNYFVVTSQRMLLATGIITRKVNMMPLGKVTDMSFQRSTLGRILGYGEFILESAGQDQALRIVDHLPYPEQLYLEVCGLIFKGKDEDD
jgi:membrane protein YdbS with pleckstrin-like domain